MAISVLSAVLASGSTVALVAGLGGTGGIAAATSPSATPGAVAAANRQGVAATDLTEMVAAATPSVVTITADGVSARGFLGDPIPTTGVGSGVILTTDGYILTNKHVVEGCQSLTVKLSDGSEYPATTVTESPDTDLALIKADATGLTVATIGDRLDRGLGSRCDVWIGDLRGPFR